MGTARGSNTQKTTKGKSRKSQLKAQKRVNENNKILKKLKLEL